MSLASSPILINWQAGTGSGWGLYGFHLAVRLAALGRGCELLWPVSDWQAPPLESRLFQGVVEHSRPLQETFRALPSGGVFETLSTVLNGLGEELLPLPLGGRRLHGQRNFGVTFFVDPALGAEARAIGAGLDGVIAGSTWNAVLLEAAGVPRVHLVIQGIDQGAFHPAPKAGLLPGRFVIFSGGKLEFRKGQDIVLTAFRQFRKRHPEALLMAAWNNEWANSAASIALSPHGMPDLPLKADGKPDIRSWLALQGFTEDEVLLLPDLPNSLLAPVLREADLAVFPNRCEPGTNLVAMEAMASGLPTILAANTGHLDLADSKLAYVLERQDKVQDLPFHRSTEGWGESSAEELLALMERAFAKRDEARSLGSAAAAHLKAFTWERQLGQLIAIVDG
ncbi:MAG: glycosyltransferase family 4 protein [Alphaproteobacteria bacterium]|nr:glycosyltransferase family 4 protein [Alphaproteobacteria bacterium]